MNQYITLYNSFIVTRRITSQEVIDNLFKRLILKGIPEHIRSDNAPEFIVKQTGELVA